MAPRIGVFPASSGLGTSVVNHLTKLISPSQLILIARNPVKWSQLGAVAATRRPADHDDPARPQDAFEGVDVLMLILHSSFDKARVDVSPHPTSITRKKNNHRKHQGYKCSRPPHSHPSRAIQRRNTRLLLLPRFRRKPNRPQRRPRHARTPTGYRRRRISPPSQILTSHPHRIVHTYLHPRGPLHRILPYLHSLARPSPPTRHQRKHNSPSKHRPRRVLGETRRVRRSHGKAHRELHD